MTTREAIEHSLQRSFFVYLTRQIAPCAGCCFPYERALMLEEKGQIETEIDDPEIIERYIGAMDVGAVKAPTIQRSE
jgi:hypothetical protein